MWMATSLTSLNSSPIRFIYGPLALSALGAKIAALAGIGALVVVLSVVYVSEPPRLYGPVVVGHLVPLSGDAAHDGANMAAVAELAVSDFNARLGSGTNWHLVLQTEDTRTDPDTARQQAQKLRDAGIMMSLGPATSANLGAVLQDKEAADMLLLSCCSSAPSLAIEDGAFRMTPDDSKEARALAALIVSQGVQTTVPVWRGDLWGDGFKEPTVEALQESGVRVEPGFRYEPGDKLADIVPDLAEAVSTAGLGTAILVFGFDEVEDLIDAAIEYGGLDEYRWFGTGINTQYGIVEDSARLEFLDKVKFTTINLKSEDSPKWQMIQEHLSLDGAPAFLAGAYDSVWLLGLAIYETQSTDPKLVRQKLPYTSDNFSGVLDSAPFNEVGDLDSADYSYWLASRDGPVMLGWYDGKTGTIEEP